MASLAPARPLPAAPPAPSDPVRPPLRAVPAPAPSSLRPEIQALRAIAVGLVVVYHLWPAILPGGFVGVDVFFAISGFLITTLLLRELERDGRISLRRFWARRARRILPAALLVLLACTVATIAVVPLNLWPQYLADLRASTAYVQNWHLAATAVDYLHSADAPSPAQHFWSLSVEEQFYLAWPLVLMAAALVARRRRRRLALGLGMGAITAASLAYGIAHTAGDPAAAYFVTPTRAWELGLGGLLALTAQRERSPAWARAALSWAGLAAIGVAALTYSTRTAFPGVAALLPVLGALAVIRAGAPAGRLAPTRALALRAVQALGDRSYALYLWHWPLLILAPFVLHHGVDTATATGILMLSLLLSALTKVLVEDPVRHGAFLAARGARWTFGLAAASTLAVLGVQAGGAAHVDAQIRADARASAALIAHRPPCFGAAAHDLRGKRCDNPKLRYKVMPTPVAASKMRNAPCESLPRLGRARPCAFGVAPAKAKATVLLLGDSHASHWRAALDAAAAERGWRGISLTHTSCPYSRATPLIAQPARGQCAEWIRDARRWIARHPEIDMVFAGQHSGGRVVTTSRDNFRAQVKAYQSAWRALPKSIRNVIVIRDTPKMHGDTMDCVQRAIDAHRRPGAACAVPRSEALERDAAVVAARRMRSARVGVLDLDRFLCARTCPPVIGGALVYKDIHHLTTVFAATLAPYLLRAVDRVTGAPAAA